MFIHRALDQVGIEKRDHLSLPFQFGLLPAVEEEVLCVSHKQEGEGEEEEDEQ